MCVWGVGGGGGGVVGVGATVRFDTECLQELTYSSIFLVLLNCMYLLR